MEELTVQLHNVAMTTVDREIFAYLFFSRKKRSRVEFLPRDEDAKIKPTRKILRAVASMY